MPLTCGLYISTSMPMRMTESIALKAVLRSRQICYTSAPIRSLGARMSFATILKQADIFYELTPTQLELVAALCQERRCNAGDLIFEENAASDELYIIAQGDVDIQVDPGLVGGDEAKGIGP